MTIETIENEPLPTPVALPASSPALSSGYSLIRETAAAMQDANLIAKAIANTEMVPKHFRGKPDDLTAAILYGATLGFDPMQSARQVYIVHGQAGLYARSMAALVMSAGHRVWTVESTDEAVTVEGQRRGSNISELSTWTIERAVKAGYVPTIDPNTGKFAVNQYGKVIGNEKYLTDPQAMLYGKACSEVCRKIAPDVLNGVYAVEELQAEDWTAEQVTPQRPVQQTSAERLRAAVRPVTAEQVTETRETAAQVEPDVLDVADAEQRMAEDSPLLNTRSNLAKAMYAAINEAGIPESDRIVTVAGIIGRSIESTKDMTEAEARIVLDALAQPAVQPGGGA